MQKIFLTLGFHVNYNHSWRGDRNDRSGFGLDSQVIEGILNILDEANAKGLSASGTWDFDNYWSIESCMQHYAPELLERIIRRVKGGTDEVILDAWNNGMLGAHSREEFRENLRRTISNPAGSGIKDLFGDYSPVVRTQETMFTQGSVELYLEQGVKAIALYYSSVPFDAIRNFVPRLSSNEMFNPLWFNSTESNARMLAIPMYSQGDVVNNLSIRRWVKKIRAEQLSGKIPGNAILYLNMDADAELWTGLNLPKPLHRIPNARGLSEFIGLVDELDYLEFGKLGDYIENNQPAGEITVRQDLADGSFTGYNSWTEKEENHRLWRIAERARRHARIAEFSLKTAVAPEDVSNEIQDNLRGAPLSYFESRLKLLSTTHFGMHAPAVNEERAQVGFHYARSAADSAAAAARKAVSLLPPPAAAPGSLFSFSVMGLPRYEECVPPSPGTEDMRAGCPRSRTGAPPAPGTRSLVRVPIKIEADVSPEKLGLTNSKGEHVPFDIDNCAVDPAGKGMTGELVFVHTAGDDPSETYSLGPGRLKEDETPAVKVTENELNNGLLDLRLDTRGRVRSLVMNGEEFSSPQLLTLGATYKVDKTKKHFTPRAYLVMDHGAGPKGALGKITLQARTVIFREGKNYPLEAEYTLSMFAGLPYLFLDAEVKFPETPREAGESGMATGSDRMFDTSWFEVMPAQIEPAIYSTKESLLRVWKHNYMDAANWYEFDYGKIDRGNRNVDSCNNHVTDGWIAVSNTERGFLLSCDAGVNSSPAYCPIRLREKDGKQKISLNPFGTYAGKQFTHLQEGYNVGAAVMKLAAPQLRSVAPSYNGRTVRARIMMAPYAGDGPDGTLRAEAGAFAMPPAVILNENGAPVLYESELEKEELAAAVNDFRLDEFRDWQYIDFLRLRNRDIPPGVPKDRGEKSPLEMIRLLLDGLRNWS